MMKIEVENNIAKVYTSYNPKFVKKIKGIGGAKWNGECWCVPAETCEIVREIMEDVYGYSDVSTNETVTLKLEFGSEYFVHNSDVCMFGKVLARAYSRDSGARVGDDVAYITGGATSGGSAKHWCSVVEEGSVVMLSNVNRKIYEKEKDARENVKVTLVGNSINRSALMEEKERLLKRIEEIDKILEQ